ncbi:MAG: hypothetical protein QOI56_704 [Actinomycetota bacterium]|jgi:hypothetical protein|nr:hypothetical protein [Actinomycetota bacterium]
MADQNEPSTDPSHGVHAATREDGGAQEDPSSASVDDESWAEATETGGDAT